jgi:hypothetical protein
MERLNITLEDEQAEKLARLADRMHLQPGTAARSLLSSALDDADLNARNVVELLGGIPGAYERAQLGFKQANTREDRLVERVLARAKSSSRRSEGGDDGARSAQ